MTSKNIRIASARPEFAASSAELAETAGTAEAMPAALHNGRVQSVLRGKQADCITVAGAFGLVNARRAAGCLLMPEPGDTVLLYLPATDKATSAYVLSVLERESQEGELALPEQTAMTARRLELKTESLAMTGRVLVQTFESVRNLAGRILERAGQRLGLYGRQIERVSDVQETTAGRVRLSARESLRLRSRNADIRAEQSVIMDAEKLKIG